MSPRRDDWIVALPTHALGLLAILNGTRAGRIAQTGPRSRSPAPPPLRVVSACSRIPSRRGRLGAVDSTGGAEHGEEGDAVDESVRQNSPGDPRSELQQRFAIQEELGRGGMGRVVVARDLKLGRRVAIKFLGNAVNDPHALRRFEQEARAAGGLNHPNIISVFDVGSSAEGPYIVTELLEGETLRQRLERGPLAPAAALDQATQLAQGLAAAHEHGIVHRDLKPENLFI